jgi:integrase
MMAPQKRRPHGSGSIFQRSDGLWIARVEAGYDRHGNRRRPQRASKTKTEAQRKLKELLRDVALDNLPDEGASTRATVKTWADTWLAMHEREVRPNVYVTDKGHVRKWIVPTLGTRRLADLNPGDLRRLHKAVTSAGRSSTTALNVHRTFMKMLKDARLEGHPIPARVSDVKAPRAAASDRAGIPVADLLALLRVVGQRDDASRWLFRLMYPVRQGEALGLTWDSVDFDGGTVTLDWQLDQYPAGAKPPTWLRSRHLVDTMWLIEPKTKARSATLPLHPMIEASLRAWREIGPANDYGLVWVDAKGKPIRDHIDRREWQAIQREADVAHPDGRPWHLHETRHAAASILIGAGEDPRIVAGLLGQTRLVDAYVHVDKDAMNRLLGKWAEVLELGKP